MPKLATLCADACSEHRLPLLIAEVGAALARAPAALALRAAGRSLTYAALDRRANGLAIALVARGAGPGAIIGLRLPCSAAYAVAMLAVAKARGIALPLDPALPAERLAAIRAQAPPVVEIAAEGEADIVTGLFADGFDAAAPPDLPPQDPRAPALISFTSGSTGTPKGVVLSAANIAAGARSWRSDAPDAGARSLMAAGPAVIISYIDLAMTLAEGTTLVIPDAATRRDPAALLDLMATERVTRALITVTPALALAEEHARRPRELAIRHWMLGAEPLRVSPAFRALAARLPGTVFVNTYGSTEAGPVARCVLPPDPGDWPATPPIGTPWPGVTCAVLDADGAPAAPGRAGELVVAGPAIAAGYWGDTVAASARFDRDVPGLPPGPAFRVGDLVRRDGDGALHWLGRVDDQIKLGGVRIEPAEVEALLLEHPAVAEAAVAAQPDAAGRTRLVALVVPRGDAPTTATLAAHLAARLPSAMVPAIWSLQTALPRLPGGKLDRRALPVVAVEAGAGRAPATPTESTLAACCADLLSLPSVSAEDDIFALGADSLMALELVTLASARGLRVATADLFAGRTIAGIAALIEARAQGAAQARLLPLTARAARPGAAEPPLILVHAVAGMVFNYVPLALRLPEMRCLGLQARGIEPGEMPDIDFDAMLDRYAAAVRAEVPEGPLRILGYSFGGVIAQDLMRRLRPNPSDDDLLILIDPVNPALPGAPPPRSLDDVLAQGLEPTRPVLARLVRPLLPLLPRRAKLALGGDSIRRFLAAAPEALAFQPISLPLVERIVAVWIAGAAMHQAVRCTPHPVRTVMLEAAERAVPDQVADWDALVGPLTSRTLPGNHFTMLAPERLPGVAAALRDALDLPPEPG